MREHVHATASIWHVFVLVMMAHTRVPVAVLLLVGALSVAGCATAPTRLPYGGYDISERGDSTTVGRAWVDAQTPCQSPILAARVHVRGTLERRRINTLFRVGLDISTGRMRLESVDTTSTRFALSASYSYGNNRKDETTLVLPTRRWAVRSSSRELVELLLGVPLSALDLQGVLTGCPVANGNLRVEEFDNRTIKLVAESDTVVELFMRRSGTRSPWAMFASVVGVPDGPTRWRLDPGRRSGGVLESVRLRSLDWNGQAGRLFDLTFSFARIQTPGANAEMFKVPPPESTDFVPVDAIRLNMSVPLLAGSPRTG